ncbi:MAG: SUMF1/EgtB/PvdO family nonheme iron enzyme [Polyangiaceae bacterium]|nr:SUMF1/EgtB/PvdO family nonheme iron enzyme [Polyangiaceae bacterium]
MDKTEVTAAAYKACLDAFQCTDAHTDEEYLKLQHMLTTRGLRLERCNSDRPGREARPINCVEWNQASRYCAWKERKLPSGYEWEYVARGGPDQSEYPWGNEEPQEGQLCWRREKQEGTCDVGTFPTDRNRWGVLDLAGNVSEWTTDGRRYNVYRGSNDGIVLTYHDYRGGSWASSRPASVSSARHDRHASNAPSDDSWYSYTPEIGFRCVKWIEGAQK